MDNIAKSLFNLVKYNKGLFKSEKQAAFIMAQCVDNVYFNQQHFSFGTSQHSQHSIKWFFTISSTGIEKVEKENKKGVAIYWENTPEMIAANNIAVLKRAKQTKKANLWNKAMGLADKYDALIKENTIVLSANLDEYLKNNADYASMPEYKNIVTYTALRDSCKAKADLLS